MESARPCHEELEAAPHPGVASCDKEKMANDKNLLFHSLEDYCWEDDPEFQSGLDAIVQRAKSPSQVRDLTQQAKCYFYARKVGIRIDFHAYKEWLHKQEQGLGVAPSDDTPGPAVVPTPTAEAPSFMPPSSSSSVGGVDGDGGDIPKGLLRQESMPSPPVPHAVLAAAAQPMAGIKMEGLNDGGIKIEDGSSGGDDQKAQYPLSFAHIVELITTGQPVPGIREIPNTLNTEAPSASVKAQRLKPWEKQQQQQQQQQPPVQGITQDGLLPEPVATAVAQE